jgi:hypothetical protein
MPVTAGKDGLSGFAMVVGAFSDATTSKLLL